MCFDTVDKSEQALDKLELKFKIAVKSGESIKSVISRTYALKRNFTTYMTSISCRFNA